MGKLLKIVFSVLTILLVISATALVVVVTPLKDQSIGRWLVTIPYANSALNFAKTKLGFALIVVVPTLLVISSQAVVIVRDFRGKRTPTVDKEVAHVTPPTPATPPPTLPPVMPPPPMPASFSPALQPDVLPKPTWQAPRAHLAATRTRTDFDSVGKIILPNQR